MHVSETVEISGHLIDTGILSLVLDDIREYGGDWVIDKFDVTQSLLVFNSSNTFARSAKYGISSRAIPVYGSNARLSVISPVPMRKKTPRCSCSVRSASSIKSPTLLNTLSAALSCKYSCR